MYMSWPLAPCETADSHTVASIVFSCSIHFCPVHIVIEPFSDAQSSVSYHFVIHIASQQQTEIHWLKPSLSKGVWFHEKESSPHMHPHWSVLNSSCTKLLIVLNYQLYCHVTNFGFCCLLNQRKFAAEQGYLSQTSKSDFWENFIEYVNTWNNLNSPNKWTKLRQEDEATYKESLFPAWAKYSGCYLSRGGNLSILVIGRCSCINFLGLTLFAIFGPS